MDPNAPPFGIAEVREVIGERFFARLLLACESIIRNKVAGRRSAHLQVGINRLYRCDCCAIQIKVLASGRVEEKPKVWLIPDFEIPLPDLSCPVTLDKMSDKSIHKVAPVMIVFRRRHMGLPPEAPHVRLSCQILREETEFDKWAHPVGQQRINQIINILPVKNQGSVLPPADEHVVMQQAVETQITKSAPL